MNAPSLQQQIAEHRQQIAALTTLADSYEKRGLPDEAAYWRSVIANSASAIRACQRRIEAAK